jgi:hypothetical protein
MAGRITVKAAAAAGIAGPAVFTGAWIVSSLRQAGYGATEVQISGLAAPDAVALSRRGRRGRGRGPARPFG